MRTATVVYDSGRGYWFADADSDHERIYIHQRDVIKKRFLKVNDRIRYELAPSDKHPGEVRAVNVEVCGRVIARQVGAGPGSAS
jgi:hypothetical protein